MNDLTFLHVYFSVTHTLKLHLGEKCLMTEIITSPTPSIQSLESEISHLKVILRLEIWKLQYLSTFVNAPTGCLSFPAFFLWKRIWRSPCMILIYWAEMKKLVRQSSTWRTDSYLVSDPVVGCHKHTVCKFVLTSIKKRCNVFSSLKERLTVGAFSCSQSLWCIK